MTSQRARSLRGKQSLRPQTGRQWKTTQRRKKSEPSHKKVIRICFEPPPPKNGCQLSAYYHHHHYHYNHRALITVGWVWPAEATRWIGTLPEFSTPLNCCHFDCNYLLRVSARIKPSLISSSVAPDAKINTQSPRTNIPVCFLSALCLFFGILQNSWVQTSEHGVHPLRRQRRALQSGFSRDGYVMHAFSSQKQQESRRFSSLSSVVCCRMFDITCSVRLINCVTDRRFVQ